MSKEARQEDDRNLVDYHIIPVTRNFPVATQSVNEQVSFLNLLVRNFKKDDRYTLRNWHCEKNSEMNIYLL